MLLDLFQFVFHLHYQALNIGVVGLGAQGVDFAAHFLRNKIERAAYRLLFAVEVFEEVAAMHSQAHFFLRHIHFFQVIQDFLLETVLVYVVFTKIFFEVVAHAFAHPNETFALEGRHLFQKRGKIGYALPQVGFLRATFEDAEFFEIIKRGGEYLANGLPLIFIYLSGSGGYHVGDAQDGLQHFSLRDVQFVGQSAQFAVVTPEQCFIEAHQCGAIGILLGIGGAMAVAELAGWRTELSTASIILAAGFAGAVGVFFGYYPARKASQLLPIEALRYE